MKQYTVEVFSPNVNVNAEYESFDCAYAMYTKAMYSGSYEHGRLLDNQSGDIYLSFKHSNHNGNWRIYQNIHNKIVPMVVQKEVYQN